MLLPQDELLKMGYANCTATEMRRKNGIALFRIADGDKSYVLKSFEKPDDRREIRSYQILRSLGVPTIEMIAHTDCAMLLEDIDASNQYRLGQEADLASVNVARLLARWYKALHTKGADFIKTTNERLYDESDALTPENMRLVMTRSQTGDNPFWSRLFERFAELRQMIDSLPRTLTYNDFYWTNFVVAKGGSEALMFDFNLLGKGYLYGDIRNVTSSLSKEAADTFMDEYGAIDEAQRAVDEVVSVLFSLVSAYERETFPKWGQSPLELLRSGALLMRFERTLKGCETGLVSESRVKSGNPGTPAFHDFSQIQRTP